MILKNILKGSALLAIYLFASCGNASSSSNADSDSMEDLPDSIIEMHDSIKSINAAHGYEFVPGKKVEGKLIALTFDDGPNPQSSPKILDIMEQYHTVCTFMTVGRCVNSNTRKYLERAHALGCEICNHTWEHPFLSTISAKERRETIEKTNEVIKSITGHNPNFFRPPYIDCDQGVLDDIPVPGLNGFSSDDWKKSTSPQEIYKNVMKQAKHGAIIVMHDISHNTRTPEALKTLVPALLEEGYTLVTVTDLFTSMGVVPSVGNLYVTPERNRVPASSHTKRERMKSAKKS